MIDNENTPTWSGIRPSRTKVHIWHASLEQPVEVIQKLEAVLSDEEKQRAGRFRFPELRQSFIVSRGILRYLLARYTRVKPDLIQFKYNLAGKPFLTADEAVPDIHFNLSHAGLLVLYAFAWGRQVGIDVEVIRPMDEMDQIVETNFSPAEHKKFQKVSETDRLRAFYNCWTRKEAFIKAVGDGLSFPLREFDVSFDPGRPAKLLRVRGSSEEAANWTMHDIKAWDGYAAALVVEGNYHSISHKQRTYAKMQEPGTNR